MRRVANRAPLHFHRCVLEQERSVFVGMAVRARFPVWSRERRAILGPMRVVTVGAFHGPFRHAVVKRLRELGARRCVTGKAENRLGVLQEAFTKLARRPELLRAAREKRAFLIRLAHNAAIDLMRRRGTR